MPTFPSIPLSEVEPLVYNDPVLRSNSEKYLFQTRIRNLRTKRQYKLEWKGLTAAEKNTIERFVRECRGSVLTFAWTYPFGQTITNTSNTNPVVVTTSHAHNFLDLDWVVVSGVIGTTAANGTHQAHYASSTTVELIGLAGNGAYVSGGLIKLHFPYMRLILESMEFRGSTKMIGPDKDHYGVYSVSIVVEEQYY